MPSSGKPAYKQAEAVNIASTDHTAAYDNVRGIWVGGAGTLIVRLANDNADSTFVGVAAGSLLELNVRKVVKTSTTATNMLLLY